MRIIFVILSLATSIGFAKSTAIDKVSSKYPYNLLTPGYKIVTDDDLAYDNYRRKIGPYDPKTSLSSLYWQCFPTEAVEIGFDAWVGQDGMGPAGGIYTMCSIKISVRAKEDPQLFVDRRGHQIQFCLDFANEWKKLIKGQKIVCLDGEGGSYADEDKHLGRYKLWTWDKLKTKKGCSSFFAGECKTVGCDEGKGPCRAKF